MRHRRAGATATLGIVATVITGIGSTSTGNSIRIIATAAGSTLARSVLESP